MSAAAGGAPPAPPPAAGGGGGGGGRVKDLFRKYGRVALGVHLVVYATFFAGCYVAVDSKADVRGLLARVGLLSERSYDEAEAEAGEAGGGKGSWLERAASGGGSSLALAFICNKALFPVRTPITLALTPPVARFLQRRRLVKTQ